MADHLKNTMYNGSWAGRGGAPFAYMGGGHMNAAGSILFRGRKGDCSKVKFRTVIRFVSAGRDAGVVDVKAIDEFDPDEKYRTRNKRFKDGTFRNNSDTNEKLFIGSGNTFMDIAYDLALKMTVKI